MNLEMRLEGWDKLADAWQRAPQIVEEELTVFIEEESAHMTGEIKALTPKKSGALQDSIEPREIEVGPLGVSALIGTPLDYALPVEFGARPHDIYPKPGNKALHFMMRGVPIFVKKVHHPGMKGFFMFTQALAANREQIQQKLNAAIERIFARLGAA